MRRAIIIVGLLITLLAIPPADVLAIETAPRITDREMVERLTRLEEDQIAENRTRIHSLIEALRTLSKVDDRVAEVLKRFNLL